MDAPDLDVVRVLPPDWSNRGGWRCIREIRPISMFGEPKGGILP